MTSKHIPRKRFGQNFLHDQNVIANIIKLVAPESDDQFIEIGPGQGALTLPLLEYVNALDVIEIDRDLVAWWKNKAIEKLTIHECDALKVDYCEIRKDRQQKARLVGNLPYNISTPLLFHILEYRHCIQDMHFMLQKEVVERITAKPGSKTYGRLSVMMQFFCETENLLTVGPTSFNPPPKVDSAIIRLKPYLVAPYPADAKSLGILVNQAFSQRRKTLRNAIKNLVTEQQITELGIDPGCRAETLPLETFARLSSLIVDKTPA